METGKLGNDVLTAFFLAVKSDSRLTPMHMSLYFVLFRYWLKGNCQNPIQVNRRSLMKYAHIKSTATYHKCIGQLQAWGYIKYQPSYHPAHGSLVYLCAA